MIHKREVICNTHTKQFIVAFPFFAQLQEFGAFLAHADRVDNEFFLLAAHILCAVLASYRQAEEDGGGSLKAQGEDGGGRVEERREEGAGDLYVFAGKRVCGWVRALCEMVSKPYAEVGVYA